MEKHFQEKIQFGTHSGKNLPPVAILKTFKLFLEKTQLFFQKSPNFEGFENSYYSGRILRQICYNLVKNNFTVRNVSEHRFSVNAIGKHLVKKTSEIAHLRGRFCFYILHMEKISNTIEQLVFNQIVNHTLVRNACNWSEPADKRRY